MSVPRKHHYVPQLYLRNFQSRERDNYIYWYDRSKRILHLPIADVAAKRDLYSIEVDGTLNVDLETKVNTPIETAAAPVISKLRQIRNGERISWRDKADVSGFVALQILRTPAFLNSISDAMGKLAKSTMRMHASNPEEFKRTVENAQKAGVLPQEVNIEEIRNWTLEGGYDIELNQGWILGTAYSMAEKALNCLMIKDICIYTVGESVNLFTTDHPAILLKNKDQILYPGFGGLGLLMSDIAIPLDPNRILYYTPRSEACPPPRDWDETFSLSVNEASDHIGNRFKGYMLAWAETYLFSNIQDEDLAKNFSKSEKVKRFQVQGPFSD